MVSFFMKRPALYVLGGLVLILLISIVPAIAESNVVHAVPIQRNMSRAVPPVPVSTQASDNMVVSAVLDPIVRIIPGAYTAEKTRMTDSQNAGSAGNPAWQPPGCQDPSIPKEQYTGIIWDVYVNSIPSKGAWYGMFRSRNYMTDGMQGVYLHTENPYILSQMQAAVAANLTVQFEGYHDNPDISSSFEPCYIAIKSNK